MSLQEDVLTMTFLHSKFIDSHLKPFRCKMQECSKQAFSSTACLLRHEREAHGMHGHGHCPHLCTVQGCERSEKGKGFPRLYNCKDHMRRAHGIESSDHGPLLSAATLPAKTHGSKQGPRKRKAYSTEAMMLSHGKHDDPLADLGYMHVSMDAGQHSSHVPLMPVRQNNRRSTTRR